MPTDWIVLAAALALILAGLRLVHARERTPSGHWVGGWIAAAIGGVIELLAVGRPQLRLLVHPLGTLFPWFLLAGALVLAERRVPAWLLPCGLGLGALRAVLAGLDAPTAAYLAGFASDLPVVLAAGWFAWRAVPREAPSLAQRLLPAAFVVLAIPGGLHLYWRATAEPLDQLLVLWVFLAPPMLALQLRVSAEWGRRYLEQAHRALERTVEQRTAELAQVNESLRQSEERYRTVSELSSDLSFGFRVYLDGRAEGEWVTDAFTRMTGFTMREMTGDRWLTLIHPEDRAGLDRSFRQMLSTGTATLLFRIVGKQGEVRWLEARERVLHDALGIRIVGAARDVTEARESEEERFRLERQMQEAQRLESLGLVTGGVAHDFNNLLTVILGNGRLGLAELPPGHALRPRLERMLAAAEHGSDLTEQMLAYAGRAPLAKKPVELSSLVAEMLDLARATLPARVLLRETLGPAVWVLGDETQLRQVVLNLVANAGEAIGAGGGTVGLRTALAEVGAAELENALGASSTQPGMLALLEVSDDGAGMDPATGRRVFEPFFTTKLSGRGLGLAAVLGIVRGHEGRVTLSTEPGRGSCFRVWLPSARAAQIEAPAKRRVPTPHAARLLVIDDQEPILELAQEYLSREGYAVMTALGGRAGLDRFLATPGDFAAVVLDLAMPDLDGDHVGQEIRRRCPALPLLLVSGHDLEPACFASLRPASFLRKPFEREELVAALEGLLCDSAPPAEDPAG